MSTPTENPKQIKGKRRYNEAGDRICTGCREFLPVDRFGPAPGTWDRLNIYCRPCQAIRVDALRKANPEKSRAYAATKQRAFYARHPERGRELTRKRRAVVKQQVMTAYGGVCACCGETQIEFLSLDHVEGGGNAHRRDVTGLGSGMYLWALKNGFPPALQILCYNCNMAKAHVGYCPHQGIPEIKPVLIRRPRIHA